MYHLPEDKFIFIQFCLGVEGIYFPQKKVPLLLLSPIKLSHISFFVADERLNIIQLEN